ncbi:chemotaxis protein CheW [uncultured Methanospirillum sp.]|uniref:chemotaxis protein CheW n=1 Tax=uncultured Methanospirillum sp. TaxID=262503 RepID=UPI0029C75999|nr:chemotaxis protein CheW [uncultured Methanospirillum sp.]
MSETEGLSKNSRKAISETEEEIQIVEFLLGNDKFAINLFDVKEIVEYTRITPLPGSGQYIKGIIDLRGEITTIIDLKAKMSITSSTATLEQSRIIVIDSSVTKGKTGILVDDVTTVLSIRESQIDKKINEGTDSQYILGIIKHNGGDRESDKTELVIWIDVPGLLRDMGQ